MKYLALIGVLALTSCAPSVTGLVNTAEGAIRGLTKLVDQPSNNVVIASNNLQRVLDQNTVVLRVSKDFSSNYCKYREPNIYGCNIGVIEPGTSKLIVYRGTVLSGTMFSYDRANNFYAADLVKK